MIRGFILGKFMPPHAGHLFACQVARQRVDELTVLVCSHDAEPIPGTLRAQWMRDSLPYPGIRIIHMHRDIPQVPEDHPDFWNIWKAAIRAYHPEPIDWVFGSEDYIFRLAETVGAKPFLVDPERKIVPVSATAIREAPNRNWIHIPSAVRPWYQSHVTLLGPESAGKTTLTALLAKEFDTLAVPEYGRDYDATFRKGTQWSERDFLDIARGQDALSAEISGRAGAVVFEDTDLIQTIVWAEALLGVAPTDLTDRLTSQRNPSLYLLLDSRMGWVDDGTRYHASTDQRNWFLSRLRHWLSQTNANWREIDGTSWDDRLRQAKSHLEDM